MYTSHTIVFTVPIVSVVNGMATFDYALSYNDIDAIHSFLYARRLEYPSRIKKYSTSVEYVLDVLGEYLIVALKTRTRIISSNMALYESLGYVCTETINVNPLRKLILDIDNAVFKRPLPQYTVGYRHDWKWSTPYMEEQISSFLCEKLSSHVINVEMNNEYIYLATDGFGDHTAILSHLRKAIKADNFHTRVGNKKKLTILE